MSIPFKNPLSTKLVCGPNNNKTKKPRPNDFHIIEKLTLAQLSSIHTCKRQTNYIDSGILLDKLH